MMLQQTRVEHVIPYYKAWTKKYPTVKKLANAPLDEVIKSWQGLGYNRRAKSLWQAAKAITALGKFPQTLAELEELPGIGPYTAGAVTTFAFNQDNIFIETNIKTAILHHFFSDREGVHDGEIKAVLKKVLPRGQARAWYSALMDYGAHLKRSGIQINNKSKGYTKQSTFTGSNREARGAILRELSRTPQMKRWILELLGEGREKQLESALEKLLIEGMVMKKGRLYQLPK